MVKKCKAHNIWRKLVVDKAQKYEKQQSITLKTEVNSSWKKITPTVAISQLTCAFFFFFFLKSRFEHDRHQLVVKDYEEIELATQW